METFTDEESEFLQSIFNDAPNTNLPSPPLPGQPQTPSMQPPGLPPRPPSQPPQTQPLPPFENKILADHVDDYSLSYILARGSEYCAKLKQKSAVDIPQNVQGNDQSPQTEPMVVASSDKGKGIQMQHGEEARPSGHIGNKRAFDGWENTYLRPNPRPTRFKIDDSNWKVPDESQGRPK